ncbi:MAG: hypothetical protein EOO96_00430 [Pedobacter sp.]|nr:MAG: hypothetical protein EOO96_00430 [Pedobacter sp.]
MTGILFLIVLIPILGFFVFKNLRSNVSTKMKVAEYMVFVLIFFTIGAFCFGWMFSSSDYYEAIDIVDGGYTPFATKHLPTLLVFFVFAVLSLIAMWLRGNLLPPIILVLAMVFATIGMFISIAVIVQLGSSKEYAQVNAFMFPLPVVYIFTTSSLLYKVLVNEGKLSSTKVYKNKTLNNLNTLLAKTIRQPIAVLILLMPVFVIVMAILVLFGQEYDAISKVFTETTTWHFSQKTHPPILDHRGHYLCTVAVCGDPKVVKPLRLGLRHGNEIVVNRQLLIANAFEELVQDFSPRLHKIIRSNYDKYGYPLSKKITTATGSNLVYRLMKPLEYFFLLVLYLFCIRPEAKINKQYAI